MSEKKCRICYECEGDNLLSPCGCKGTMEFAHKDCILEWIIERNGERVCEICKQQYDILDKYQTVDLLFFKFDILTKRLINLKSLCKLLYCYIIDIDIYGRYLLINTIVHYIVHNVILRFLDYLPESSVNDHKNYCLCWVVIFGGISLKLFNDNYEQCENVFYKCPKEIYDYLKNTEVNNLFLKEIKDKISKNNSANSNAANSANSQNDDQIIDTNYVYICVDDKNLHNFRFNIVTSERIRYRFVIHDSKLQLKQNSYASQLLQYFYSKLPNIY